MLGINFLFRYKAACGKQYVADFLIGRDETSSEEARFTLPGDSGTIWHLDIDAEAPQKDRPVDDATREIRHEEGTKRIIIITIK